YDHFKEIVTDGFALAWWCGEDICEIAIKTETKATSRCIPDMDLPAKGGTCIYCGKMSKDKAYFAKSY
ncbi:MAG: proline--tRNA ligase, partial [Chloroflexota bacterium]|nr:proline--tRNA ligase [Chloroflexota bacterium]